MLKNHIRKKIIKLREVKNKKNLQVKINLISKVLKSKNKILGGYFPVNCEADTFQLMRVLKQKKFKLSLPVVSSKFDMNFYLWDFNEPLSVNKYGIPEPKLKKKVVPEVLLIPMVAFDTKLNRIGYGGG